MVGHTCSNPGTDGCCTVTLHIASSGPCYAPARGPSLWVNKKNNVTLLKSLLDFGGIMLSRCSNLHSQAAAFPSSGQPISICLPDLCVSTLSFIPALSLVRHHFPPTDIPFQSDPDLTHGIVKPLVWRHAAPAVIATLVLVFLKFHWYHIARPSHLLICLNLFRSLHGILPLSIWANRTGASHLGHHRTCSTTTRTAAIMQCTAHFAMNECAEPFPPLAANANVPHPDARQCWPQLIGSQNYAQISFWRITQGGALMSISLNHAHTHTLFCAQ